MTAITLLFAARKPVPDRAVPITARDERIATEAELAEVNAAATLGECFLDIDYLHALDIAIARGDKRLVGDLFFAARQAVARRCALHALHGEDAPAVPTARQVCNDVFLQATNAAGRRAAADGELLRAAEQTLSSVRIAIACGTQINLELAEKLLGAAVARAKGGAA